MHNALLHSTPVIVRSNTNKQTQLKLMEKFSHLHGLSGIMQMKNKEKEVEQIANEPKKNANNKIPSVKVYQRHAQRSSVQGNSAVRSKNKSANQEEIIITAEPLLSANQGIKHVNAKKPQYDDTESGIFDQSETDNETKTSNMKNQLNAPLQMMLHNLAQLYEEKLTRQETELEHLRRRVQKQEKLMKQLAHVTMDLKADLDKVK
ncbi:unnamed protein product, partial [Meganyctiphanes norvegica]